MKKLHRFESALPEMLQRPTEALEGLKNSLKAMFDALKEDEKKNNCEL